MNSIKLVAFDLDDTLWDGAAVLAHAETKTFEWMQTHHPDVASCWSIESLKSLRKSMISPQLDYALQLTESRQRSFASAAAQVGYNQGDATDFAAMAIEVFLQARSEVELFSGVEELLNDLSTSFTLASISNGNCRVHTTPIGKYFDLSVSAEEIGAAKPDSGMLSHCQQSLNLSPSECILVGDSDFYDGQAARAAGWHFIHYDVNGLPLERTINNLAQLPEAIGTFCHSDETR
ncbi:HAD family hydrolase [Umboniibacter marinipuniceus]|uniref:Putative hydrolase of the HAD superfamily n=1 Tax=Umboniibacter marinipuniceus TaxID=569599 RepID=A0A3M0ACJ2_9GAMM|nr:HAD family hydrolase [Umboniibacter marinipuniceus]RMA82197.1 putative hydrolase of the HAD superfamily [Umboniibacter marinipuniceus]